MSKNLVWYASYGSNLDRNRFLCYIQGGKPQGSSQIEVGCRDKSLPLKEKSIYLPYPLYFTKEAARWNNGGVAFIGKEKSDMNGSLGRMYLITEDQFLDVVSQENHNLSFNYDLQEVIEKGSMSFRDSWYGNIVYLGKDKDHPIFTFTSNWSLSELEYQAPSQEYLSTIIRGIKDTYQMSSTEVINYLIDKPGISSNWTKADLESIC